MNTTISSNSPKNTFRASITFSSALKEIGGATNVKAMTLDKLHASVKATLARLTGWKEAHVQVLENKATYPSFDWQEVETYTVNE